MSEPETPRGLAEHVAALTRRVTEQAQVGDVIEVQHAVDALLEVEDHQFARADKHVACGLLDAAPSVGAIGDLARCELLMRKGIIALSVNQAASQVDLIAPLTNLMALYDQAGAHPQRDQTAVAITSIVEHLDRPLTANAAIALIQLGAIYMRSGDVQAALMVYAPAHRYLTVDTDTRPDTLLTWARTYLTALTAAGDHAAVMDVCRQAIEVADQEREVEFHVRLAHAATLDHDRSTAEASLERAVALAEAVESAGGSDDPRAEAARGAAYHNLATSYVEHGHAARYPRAEELLRRALAIVLRREGGRGSAEHAGALGQLGVVTEKCGDVDEADRLLTESLSVYESADDANPAEFTEFANDLGFMRLAHGRAADAVVPFRRVVELREGPQAESPRRLADSVSNLGTALFESGDLIAASREYTRALDLRFAESAGEAEQ